jgi:2'-5' RNA ligase
MGEASAACEPGYVCVGVAVAVPEPWASFLRRARAAYGDPQADHVPPHVTLIPPTCVDASTLAAVTDFVRSACRPQPAFPMALKGTATFRPVSAVVHVQVIQGRAECEELERALRAGPLAQELTFPYHPHVTIAQDVPDADLDRALGDLADFEATFPVGEISLFTQGADRVWHAHARIPLAPSQ